MTFRDRVEAGTILAAALKDHQAEDPVILGLPRGGVIIAAVIAQALAAPLGTALVRKIGHPNAPEYAIGAIAEGGTKIFNPQEVAMAHKQFLDAAQRDAGQLIQRRRELYYPHRTPPEVKGKTVILVDDGIATGLSMQAAAESVRLRGARRIIVAAPVAPWDAIKRLERLVDGLVLLDNPENFLGAIGAHYINFDQVDDLTVRDILAEVNTSYVKQNSA